MINYMTKPIYEYSDTDIYKTNIIILNCTVVYSCLIDQSHHVY